MTAAIDTAIMNVGRSSLDGAGLAAWVREWVGRTGDAYTYTESLSACTLSRVDLAAWMPPGDAFGGRVFSADAEVRWRKTAGGTFDAWGLREVAPATQSSENVTRVERHYYLVGRGTDTPGHFEEARFPGKVFEYPVEHNWTTDEAPNARAFVKVIEYGPAEPGDWEAIAGKESAAVVEALNRPRLVAHRFAGVGADMGSK